MPKTRKSKPRGVQVFVKGWCVKCRRQRKLKEFKLESVDGKPSYVCKGGCQ